MKNTYNKFKETLIISTFKTQNKKSVSEIKIDLKKPVLPVEKQAETPFFAPHRGFWRQCAFLINSVRNHQCLFKYQTRIAILFALCCFLCLIPFERVSLFTAYASQEVSEENATLQADDQVSSEGESSQEIASVEDEHTHFDIFDQDVTFYQKLARVLSDNINIKSLQRYIKEQIVPSLTTYSANPKYTIYSGDASTLTLTAKITSESRLGTILNEWVFHGSTANIAEQAKDIYDLATKLKVGQSYYVTIDINTNELLQFEYEINKTSKIVIDLTPMIADASKDVRIYKDTITYELKLEYVTGEIQGNFSNSAIMAGENANFVNNFADVFSSDIDFSREIHNGDAFTALVEKRYRDGDFIGYGDILAAQLVNKGHTYKAYYFYESPLDDDPFASENLNENQKTSANQNSGTKQNTQSLENRLINPPQTTAIAEISEEEPKLDTQNTISTQTEKQADMPQTSSLENPLTINTFIERPPCVYFDETGKARQKAFLRAPVHFTRVSSVYTMNRRHPILGVTRPHQGIDYAAPTGTPVYTVGDGLITFVGWSGGYGKLIKVRHAGGLESQYAHLSKYASGLKVGSRVLQGETIGYVGSTGLSTGPHLDFRIKKNGQFVNPDDIIIPSKAPVTPNRLVAYLENVKILDAYLSGEKPLTDYDPSLWLSAPAPPE